MYIIILLGGTPSNVLSVKFENKKIYFGGTIPVVNTIAEISRNMTLHRLLKTNQYKILKNINHNQKKFFYEKKYKDIFGLVLLILIERNFLIL